MCLAWKVEKLWYLAPVFNLTYFVLERDLEREILQKVREKEALEFLFETTSGGCVFYSIGWSTLVSGKVRGYSISSL